MLSSRCASAEVHLGRLNANGNGSSQSLTEESRGSRGGMFSETFPQAREEESFGESELAIRFRTWS